MRSLLFGRGPYVILIFSLALGSRFLVVIAGPWVQGDSFTYLTVAENIFRYGCVSLSLPESGECIPNWGGNQLPGYPLFIGAVWIVAGKSIGALLIAQSAIYAAAAAFAAHALVLLLPRCWISAVPGFVFALAPSTMGFARTVLTEELAAALALIVLGLLVRSLVRGRFHTWSIGIASVAAFFVRYDLALLIVPIAICGLHVSGARRAAFQGIVILMIVALPVAAWSVRNVAKGLDPLPPFGIGANGQPLARGPLDWMGTWVTSQRELATSVWPLAAGNFEAIRTPWDHEGASTEIGRALTELRLLAKGSEVPEALDARFSALAVAARGDLTLRWGIAPLKRIARVWLDPLPSLGWPGDLSESDRISIRAAMSERGFVSGALGALSAYPAAASSKMWVNGWRYITLLAAVAAVLGVLFVARLRPYRFLVLLAFSFVAVRSVAFSFTLLVETRYLSPAMPWLELVATIGILSTFSAQFSSGPVRLDETSSRLARR